MGHCSAQTPQSLQFSGSRFTRVKANRENGFSTAANGQSQRQNGTVMTSEAARIAPATTYAQNVMSAPCRLISA